MTKQEMVKILKVIDSIYDNFNLTENKIRAWYVVCGDCDYQEFLFAVQSYVSESKWNPTPADILQKLNPIKENEIEIDGLQFFDCFILKNQKPKTKNAMRAFQIWGGTHQMRTLPDALYSENISATTAILRNERERFCKIYKHVCAKEEHSKLKLLANPEAGKNKTKTIELIKKTSAELKPI